MNPEIKSLAQYVTDIKENYPVGSAEALRMARQQRLQDSLFAQSRMNLSKEDTLLCFARIEGLVTHVYNSLTELHSQASQEHRVRSWTAPPERLLALFLYRTARMVIGIDPEEELPDVALSTDSIEDVLAKAPSPDDLRQDLPHASGAIIYAIPRIASVWNSSFRDQPEIQRGRDLLGIGLFTGKLLVDALNSVIPPFSDHFIEDSEPHTTYLHSVFEYFQIPRSLWYGTVAEKPESKLDYVRAYERAIEEQIDHRQDVQQGIVTLFLSSHPSDLMPIPLSTEDAFKTVTDRFDALNNAEAVVQAILEEKKLSPTVFKQFGDKRTCERTALAYVQTQLRRHRSYFDAYLKS